MENYRPNTKIRVLHVLSELGGGGVASLIVNYYKQLREECVFDFVVTTEHEGSREKELKEMGSSIYHVPELHKNLFQHIRMLKVIIRDGNYDVLHVHGDYKGVFALWYGKKYNVKKRIAHSHRTTFFSAFDKVQAIVFVPLTIYLSTNLAACGSDAGNAIWNRSKKHDYYIIRNAIPLEEYKYNAETRERLRNELMINDKYVVGNVGRLNFQKNQLMLVRIFKKVVELNQNAVLVIIGDGELRTSIEEEVMKNGISDSVLLLGLRKDVKDLYNAMDMFVLPSLFEGLPVSLVEVQTNGIPCVVSDVITKEIGLSDNIEYISLQSSLDYWAEEIAKHKNRYSIDMIREGYDIGTEARKLVDFYNS